MSHSQWEKKKGKLAAQSGRISKLYTKLVKLITDEAKKAAGNREAPGLRAAIQKARDVDMPSDNIERAIKKATEPGSAMETIVYEAYGPGGVGMVIVALTDNRNKAAQEIRHILDKNGHELGAIGSVTWGFEQKRVEEGLVWEPTTTISLSPETVQLVEMLVDALEESDEVQEVFTNME